MSEKPIDSYTRFHFKAFLGHHISFWNYLTSYRNAFHVLMDSVENSDRHVDHIAYPLLFIARHCMELGFKANIRYFQKYSEKKDYKNANTHDLEKLFAAFKLHVIGTIDNLKPKYGIEVEEADIAEFNSYCKQVGQLTNIFHKLDQQSDSFRYPVDKKNNISFEGTDEVNLIDVKELLDKSMVLLIHTSDVFQKYTDYAEEIERMYEEEMKSNYEYYE